MQLPCCAGLLQLDRLVTLASLWACCHWRQGGLAPRSVKIRGLWFCKAGLISDSNILTFEGKGQWFR